MSTNAKSVQATTRHARTLSWLPVVAVVRTFVTATPLVWNKGLGVFLLAFVYLPGVLFTCLGLFIWAVVERKSRQGRGIFMAFLAIPLVMGLTLYLVPRFKDEIRFLVWSRIHADTLNEYAKKDAVILDWESWGLAGMENDSYLVSNPADNLSEPSAASEWPRRIGSTCEIVATK